MSTDYEPRTTVSGDIIKTVKSGQRVEILATDERNYSITIEGDLVFRPPVLNPQVDIYAFVIENAKIVVNGDVVKALT